MESQKALHAAGCAVVAGVDEVGRGALAGPVSAGAVVLDVGCTIEGLNDSKKLSPQRREQVAASVRGLASAFAVAHVQPAEIDAMGIGPASRLAMSRALDALDLAVDHVLVDGNDGRIGWPSTAVVRGDSLVACIAAASVVAKVERDEAMLAESGIRVLRERPVFTTPNVFPPAGFEQVTYGDFAGPYFVIDNKNTRAEFVKMWKQQPHRDLPFRFGYPDSDKHNHLMITRPKSPAGAASAATK